MKKYILLVYLSFSALAFAFDERIAAVLTNKIFLSRNVELVFRKWTDSERNIKTPPATWVLLLKIHENKSQSCLFYRENFEKVKGVLRLVSAVNCDESYDEQSYSLDHIENLKMSFESSSGTILLNFSQASVDREMSFIYPSYKGPKVQFELLDDSSPAGVLSYVSLSLKQNIDTQMIGKFTDNYRDTSAILCHKVDDNCQDVIANNCSSCAFGAYEVVDHHCPQGGSKYCGVNRCGEQGQPACPRGEVAATRALAPGEVLDWCSKDSSAGFCQRGLAASCDGNGVLVCL